MSQNIEYIQLETFFIEQKILMLRMYIDQLFAHPERLKSLAGWLTDNDIAALARPKGSPLTRSDIPLLDEAMDMLGPDPKTVARQYAAAARRAAGEQ